MKSVMLSPLYNMNPLHYPDIERCKKLTEIGFPKNTLFCYVQMRDPMTERRINSFCVIYGKEVTKNLYAPAPIATELLGKIPYKVVI